MQGKLCPQHRHNTSSSRGLHICFIPNFFLSTETGSLLGLLHSHSLCSLLKLGLCLKSHDSSSPLSEKLGILVEHLKTQVLEGSEGGSILLVDASEAYNSSSLLVYKSSKTSLVLYNKVWDFHLTAESRHPHDKLNGVNIAGDKNKLGLLLLNKSSYVLKTVFDLVFSASRGRSTRGSSGGSLFDALLLGSISLGTVLGEKVEHSHGLILANGFGKLVDGRGDLKTLVEDSTLTLDAYVLGPLYETGEITARGTNGSTDSEGTRSGGEKGIGLFGCRGGFDGLAALLGSSFLWCHFYY
mmetsp:Transcript_24989/g.33120  ORF Transcript_24989/g.33120 Transcript_24989/m.33120 type:complete len:298 (-) Transcript_24989:56-949(-)